MESSELIEKIENIIEEYIGIRLINITNNPNYKDYISENELKSDNYIFYTLGQNPDGVSRLEDLTLECP